MALGSNIFGKPGGVFDMPQIIWSEKSETEGFEFAPDGHYMIKSDGTKVSMVEEAAKSPMDRWVEKWYEKNKS